MLPLFNGQRQVFSWIKVTLEPLQVDDPRYGILPRCDVTPGGVFTSSHSSSTDRWNSNRENLSLIGLPLEPQIILRRFLGTSIHPADEEEVRPIDSFGHGRAIHPFLWSWDAAPSPDPRTESWDLFPRCEVGGPD